MFVRAAAVAAASAAVVLFASSHTQATVVSDTHLNLAGVDNWLVTQSLDPSEQPPNDAPTRTMLGFNERGHLGYQSNDKQTTLEFETFTRDELPRDLWLLTFSIDGTEYSVESSISGGLKRASAVHSTINVPSSLRDLSSVHEWGTLGAESVHVSEIRGTQGQVDDIPLLYQFVVPTRLFGIFKIVTAIRLIPDTEMADITFERRQSWTVGAQSQPHESDTPSARATATKTLSNDKLDIGYDVRGHGQSEIFETLNEGYTRQTIGAGGSFAKIKFGSHTGSDDNEFIIFNQFYGAFYKNLDETNSFLAGLSVAFQYHVLHVDDHPAPKVTYLYALNGISFPNDQTTSPPAEDDLLSDIETAREQDSNCNLVPSLVGCALVEMNHITGSFSYESSEDCAYDMVVKDTRVKGELQQVIKNARLDFFETDADFDNLVGEVNCADSYAFAVSPSGVVYSTQMKTSGGRSCFVDWDSAFETISDTSGTFQIVYALKDVFQASVVQVHDEQQPITAMEVYVGEYLLAREIITVKDSDSSNNWMHTLKVSLGRFTQHCQLPDTVSIKLGDWSLPFDDSDFCVVQAARFSDGDEADKVAYVFATNLEHIYRCGHQNVVTMNGETFFELSMVPVLDTVVSDDSVNNFAGAQWPTGSSAIDTAIVGNSQSYCLGEDWEDTSPVAATMCQRGTKKRALITSPTYKLFLQQVNDVDGDTSYNVQQTNARILAHSMIPCDGELGYYGKLKVLVEVEASSSDASFVNDLQSQSDISSFVSAAADGEEFESITKVACPVPTVTQFPSALSGEGASYKVCFEVVFPSCQVLETTAGGCKFDYLGALTLGISTCTCSDSVCCTEVVIKEPIIPCRTYNVGRDDMRRLDTVSGGGEVDTGDAIALPVTTYAPGECASTTNALVCPAQRPDQTIIHADYSLSLETKCTDANNQALLRMNNEIEVRVALENPEANSDGFTFFIQDVTVQLKEPGTDTVIKSKTFLRSHKVLLSIVGDTTSAYSYDAHFCRYGGADNNDNAACEPFYSQFAPVDYVATSPIDAQTGVRLREVSEGVSTYANCPDFTDRMTDSFFFTPRFWAFNDYNGLVAELDITATVVLSRCTGAASDASAPVSVQLRLLDGEERTDGQLNRRLESDVGKEEVGIASGVFTLFKPASECESKLVKSKCKGKCTWLQDPQGPGGSCLDREIVASLDCPELGAEPKLCKRKAGCMFNKQEGTCESVSEGGGCGNYASKKACKRDALKVGTKADKCAWTGSTCMSTSEMLSRPCSELDASLCKKADGCLLGKWDGGRVKTCMAKADISCEGLSFSACKSAKGVCKANKRSKTCVPS